VRFQHAPFDQPVSELEDFTPRDVFVTPDAYELAITLIEVSNVWDDLIDGEPVAFSVINAGFYACLITIPENAFYRQHIGQLHPLMKNAIANFLCANRFENDREPHGVELAHMLRYGVVNVIAQIVLIVHTMERAMVILPILYKALCGERFEEYRDEIMKRGVENG